MNIQELVGVDLKTSQMIPVPRWWHKVALCTLFPEKNKQKKDSDDGIGRKRALEPQQAWFAELLS